MRVAIQLFGHVRSFRDTYPSLKKYILGKYDCDLFIHTWKTEEHTDTTWHIGSSSSIRETNKDELKSLYKPRKINIEDNCIIEHQGLFNPQKTMTLRAIKAMLYAQKQVNNLRLEYQEETNTEYEWVITLRPDVMPLTPLELNDYKEEPEFERNSSIHFANGAHCHIQGTKIIYTPLASDLFFIAKPNVMTVLCSAIDEFEKFYQKFESVNQGGISAPEASYLEYIHHQGVQPRFYTFPYIVKRTSGEHHLVIGLEYLSHFKHTVEIPSFVNLKQPSRLKSPMLAFLSVNSLNKLQKELKRFIRRLECWINLIEQVKSDK